MQASRQVDPLLDANRSRIKELLLQLTTGEGLRPTLLDGVRLARSEHGRPRSPVLYEPSIYVIASGRKTGYVGPQRIVYDENNYLVLAAPLPLECQTETPAVGPLLGVSIRMDMNLIGELAAKMVARNMPADTETGCIRATPMDARMGAAVVRLLECLRSAQDAAVLGPGIIREIAYHVLQGPDGGVLFAMLHRTGPLAQIHAALHRMHTRYREPLNVPRMAEEIGMSVSAFHHNFKAVTASSPLQYLKSVRLHKARLLMTHDGVGAALAAGSVGYESPLQFSREYKRFFGNSPAEESRRLREVYSVPPPRSNGAELSS